MGPGGDTITNDSRVIISPTSSSGNNYTSSIQFTYLVEGDNGTYTCNVMILATSESESIMLANLTSMFAKLYIFMCMFLFALITVPTPNVTVTLQSAASKSDTLLMD